MILLRAGRLADAFRERRLSEEDKLSYVVAGAVLSSLTQLWTIWAASADETTGHALVVVVVGLAATIAGILWCFSANRRGDGVDFVLRYFCLGVPVGVRVFGGTFLLLWIVAAVAQGRFEGALESPWYGLAVNLGMVAAFFTDLRRCMARAAGAGRPPSTASPLDEHDDAEPAPAVSA